MIFKNWKNKHELYLFAFLGICLWTASILDSQEMDSLQLFKVKKANLDLLFYPWGEELHLSVEGKAVTALKKASLTISIYYAKNKVVWYNLPLAMTENNSFNGQWGPINLAAQEVLPGEYEIIVEFLPELQQTDIRKHWEAVAQKKKFTKYQVSISIRLDLYQAKLHEWREFYITRMKVLNSLFDDLMQRKQKAFQALTNKTTTNPSDQSIFIEFQNWLKQEFLPKIDQEKMLLKKHLKQVFYPLYPITNMNMIEYCQVLENLARMMWGEFYNRYQMKQGNKSSKTVLSARDDIQSLVRFIQALHSRSAKELGISLRKELGYLPPPGFF